MLRESTEAFILMKIITPTFPKTKTLKIRSELDIIALADTVVQKEDDKVAAIKKQDFELAIAIREEQAVYTKIKNVLRRHKPSKGKMILIYFVNNCIITVKDLRK